MYIIINMSRINSTFDINKFCNGEKSTCNNVGYNRVVTTNNDPSITKRLRYSQVLRAQRFKQILVPGPKAPAVNTPQPLYLFATGQIFTRSGL